MAANAGVARRVVEKRKEIEAWAERDGFGKLPTWPMVCGFGALQLCLVLPSFALDSLVSTLESPFYYPCGGKRLLSVWQIGGPIVITSSPVGSPCTPVKDSPSPQGPGPMEKI